MKPTSAFIPGKSTCVLTTNSKVSEGKTSQIWIVFALHVNLLVHAEFYRLNVFERGPIILAQAGYKIKVAHLSFLLQTFTPEGSKPAVGLISVKIAPRNIHPIDDLTMQYIQLRFAFDFLSFTIPACADLSWLR